MPVGEEDYESLDAVVRALGEAATPEGVARVVAEHAQDLLGGRCLVVVGPHQGRAPPRVLHPTGDLDATTRRLVDDAEGPLRAALAGKHAVILGGGTAVAAGWSADASRALLFEPLVIRNRVVGAAAFSLPPHAPALREDGRTRLVLRQFALALERAFLHEHENEARDELVAESTRFRSLVQELDAVFWEGDPDTFAFSFVSQRAETLLGYPLRRWYEPGFWASIIHPEDRAWAVDFCVRCTRDGQDHVFEYRVVDARGQLRWLRDVVYVLRDEDGRPALLRGVMLDVTRDRAGREDVAPLARRLERAPT